MFIKKKHWVPSRGRSESAALGMCVCIERLLYTHSLRVLPIHFGRETVPSAFNSHITLAYITHQLHSVTRIGTRIARKQWAIVWPASNQCFGPAVLRYHWTGTMLGECKTVVGLRWQSNALSSPKSPHILRIVSLPKTYTRRSANIRPASQAVSQH